MGLFSLFGSGGGGSSLTDAAKAGAQAGGAQNALGGGVGSLAGQALSELGGSSGGAGAKRPQRPNASGGGATDIGGLNVNNGAISQPTIALLVGGGVLALWLWQR